MMHAVGEYCQGSFQVVLSGTKFLQQSAKCLQENFKRRRRKSTRERKRVDAAFQTHGEDLFSLCLFAFKTFFLFLKVIILCISSRLLGLKQLSNQKKSSGWGFLVPQGRHYEVVSRGTEQEAVISSSLVSKQEQDYLCSTVLALMASNHAMQT